MSDLIAPRKKSSGRPDTITGKEYKIIVSGTISSIALLGNNIVRYAFSNTPNYRNFKKGSYITISGCDNALNDGTFLIYNVDYTNYYLDVVNPSGVADINGGGTADFSIEGYALDVYSVIENSGVQDVNVSIPSSTPTQVKKTVGTSAIKLAVGSSKLAGRRKLLFQPVEVTGGSKFYVGSSTVTTSGATQGLLVYADSTYEYQDQSDWYIISDTAGQEVVIIELA